MTSRERIEEVLARLERILQPIDLGRVRHFDEDGKDCTPEYAAEVRAIIDMHRELLADMDG